MLNTTPAPLNAPLMSSADSGREGNARVLRRLMDQAEFERLLLVSERTFHYMDANGLIPAAMVIGPRSKRWLYPDHFDAVVNALPTAGRGSEPETLAAGRRSRIEKLKAAATSAAAGQ